MRAGLSPALLKAIEGLNKEPDWPNTPRAVYLRMPKAAPCAAYKASARAASKPSGHFYNLFGLKSAL